MRPSDLAAHTLTQNVQRDDNLKSFLRRGSAKELWIGPQREDGSSLSHFCFNRSQCGHLVQWYAVFRLSV
jgi:hypothetical protein